ncbi:MAG: hypothetical protein KIT39_06620 [Nitrospirales bacterium]|nr:hypothetical protein [Nitrospirales bacterium]
MTWNYDLPNGDYNVSLASGDPSWDQGPHHITIEGITVINNQTTATNQFITITNQPISVADGQLSLQLTRTSSTHTILNYVIITPASSDTTPPAVTLTAPSAGTVSGTVTVSASASDNVGVTSVQFRLQGANLGAEDTTNPYSKQPDIPPCRMAHTFTPSPVMRRAIPKTCLSRSPSAIPAPSPADDRPLPR